jgi:hypothetical protein
MSTAARITVRKARRMREAVRWLPPRGRVLAAGLAATFLAFLTAVPGAARVMLTVDEALALAFPGCEIERRTVYLTAAQLAQAREKAGVEVESALVHPYTARCGGAPGGTAYFDTHRVRTLPETLMVVLGTDGRVRRLEVLSFSEPEEYLPRGPWYDQFLGQGLGEELALKRRIRGITGATLTARATTDAVRRVLALHQVLSGKETP